MSMLVQRRTFVDEYLGSQRTITMFSIHEYTAHLLRRVIAVTGASFIPCKRRSHQLFWFF
jgi:hypothetical protein